MRNREVAEAGLEPGGVGFDVTNAADKQLRSDAVEGGSRRAAKSGAVSGDLTFNRLAELWPMLSPDDQAALLAHAEHLLTSLTDKANH